MIMAVRRGRDMTDGTGATPIGQEAVPVEFTAAPQAGAPEGAREAAASAAEAQSAPGVVPPSSATPATERALPAIEHAIGETRMAILGHFGDIKESCQSMNQIKMAFPHIAPNTIETCVRREYEAGRLLRVAPGTYRLAPPEPPKSAAKAESTAEPSGEERLLAAIEAFWADHSWNETEFGPPPDSPNNKIPYSFLLRVNDRLRKREQRQRDAEAAAARQAAADHALLNRLLDACNGNYMTPSPDLGDLAPIKAVLEYVPLENVLASIRRKTEYPRDQPVSSWREPVLLKAIAEDYCHHFMVPSMVRTWSTAGLPAPKPADAPNASTAVSGLPKQENASAAPPRQRTL